MGTSRTARPRRKRAGQYHHGDLRRALIDQAVRAIDRDGPEGLTLRGVGEALGVSRTALYRHFADKEALVAAVAREGFRALREGLVAAWDREGRGLAGFEAMADAYRRFAVEHPAHYRVMFGRVVESRDADPELGVEAEAAFRTLLDALVELQRTGVARAEDPMLQAHFVWSVTHGIAMLIIDGRLGADPEAGAALTRYAAAQIRAALGAPAGGGEASEASRVSVGVTPCVPKSEL